MSALADWSGLSVSDTGKAPQGSLGPLVRVTLVATFALFPPFLVGALSPEIQVGRAVSAQQVGIGVGGFFAVSSVSALVLRGLIDRKGPAFGLRAAAFATASCCLAIAIFPMGAAFTVVAVAMGGVGNAFATPASSWVLLAFSPAGRGPLVFGVKQAVVALPSLIGGLLLPVVVALGGWRLAFVGVSVLVLLLLPLRRAGKAYDAILSRHSPRLVTISAQPGEGEPETSQAFRDSPATLRFLGLMFFFGLVAAVCLTTYLVDALVAAEISPAVAGLTLAAGAMLAMVVRVALGWRMGRNPDAALSVSARLFSIGSSGFVMLALGFTIDLGAAGDALLVSGGLIAFGIGWGWSGLALFDVAHSNPTQIGRSTSFILVGSALGGAFGPIFAGFIYEGLGSAALWVVCFLSMQVASLSANLAVRRRRQGRSQVIELR